MPPTTIKSADPKIEIYFESKSFENEVLYDDATKITISKVPRIRVSYETPVDIQVVFSEIEWLMSVTPFSVRVSMMFSKSFVERPKRLMLST